MFDWRQLHRWNIATDQLPAGSAVLNYQYSPWEIYRWRIVGLLALLGVESVLIALLLRNNAKRKRAETALHNKEEQLAEAQRLAQLTAWRWDPKSDVLTCSDTFFTLTGFPSRPTYFLKELSAFFTDESWARLTEDTAASLETGAPFDLELKGHRSDQTQVWMTIRGEAVRDSEGRVIQLRGTMQDISERKRADEARLKHSAIVESTEDAIISKDLNGIIVRWNLGAERIFGFSEAEAAGHPITIIIPRELQDEEQRMLQKLKTGERIEHYETVRVSKEGKRINVSISLSPVRDSKGRIVGGCKIARDITKQKRAEELLRRSEEKFSKAFRQSPMAITLASAKDHRFIEVNDTFEQATGWSREEVIGHTPFDLNLWQDRSVGNEMVQRILAGKPVRDLEVRLRNRNGESRIGLASADLIEIDGESCILTAIVDITERKLTEGKLQDSENLVAGVVGSAMDAIITVNEEQRIVLFNAAAEKIFACSAQDALGKPIENFIPERFRVAQGAHIGRSGETGVNADAVGEPASLWARRTNGEEFPIEASIAQLKASGKKLYTVIIRDVTARRQADAALRESERRFRLVADTAPVMIWMAGTDKLFNYFNRTWLEFTGRPVESQMGNGWVEAIYSEDRGNWVESYRAMFEKRLPLTLEYRLRRHDGEYRWVSIRAVPRFQDDGSFAGYVGCGLDVTEEKEAKAAFAELGGRLIQAQEQERSRIARELHDDISQRLALLANCLVELNPASGNTAQSGKEQQLEALFRLTNEIANDVQNLSHRLHPSKLHYVGLASAARQLCQEVSRQHKIEIECQVQDLPRDIQENVSLSLFRTIQESLRNVVKHSHAKHVKVELAHLGGVIRLRISDDGVGFDSKGTGSHGLGLVSMQERLRSVGGEFSIWSRPSLGTQVEVRVPAHVGVARSA
jgi:PAS domain S-box-containing protein